MTGLPTVTPDECVRALQRAGFSVVRQKGSHVQMRRDEPAPARTVPMSKTFAKRYATIHRSIGWPHDRRVHCAVELADMITPPNYSSHPVVSYVMVRESSNTTYNSDGVASPD